MMRRLLELSVCAAIASFATSAAAAPSWEETARAIGSLETEPTRVLHLACGDGPAGALLPEGSLLEAIRRHAQRPEMGDLLQRARTHLDRMRDTGREVEVAWSACTGLLEEWRQGIAYPHLRPPEEAALPGDLPLRAEACVAEFEALEQRLLREAFDCLGLVRAMKRAALQLPNYGVEDLLIQRLRRDLLTRCDDKACDLQLDAFRLDRIPWLLDTPGLRGQLHYLEKEDEVDFPAVAFIAVRDCRGANRLAQQWLRSLRDSIGPSPGGVLEPEGFASGCILASEAVVRIGDYRAKVRVQPADEDEGEDRFEVRLLFFEPNYAHPRDEWFWLK